MASPQRRQSADRANSSKNASAAKKSWVKRDAATGRIVDMRASEPDPESESQWQPPRGDTRRITLRSKAVGRIGASQSSPANPDPTLALVSELLAIAEAIPASELTQIPSDGARNLDHYLYGHKKVEG